MRGGPCVLGDGLKPAVDSKENPSRSSAFHPIPSCALVAERLDITNALVLSPAPRILAGAADNTAPKGYEHPGEVLRFAVPRRPEIYQVRDNHSAELPTRWHVGKCWYMDWTRMSERSLDGNHFGLVFVELRTWLLRIRLFSNKPSCRLVEGILWL